MNANVHIQADLCCRRSDLGRCVIQCFVTPKRLCSTRSRSNTTSGTRDIRITAGDDTANASATLGIQRGDKDAATRESYDARVQYSHHQGADKRVVSRKESSTAFGVNGTAKATSRVSYSLDRNHMGNKFLRKLTDLETAGLSRPSATSQVARRHNRAAEQKVLGERKKMLVFRDVGMDLDKPILSRDVFLVLKYFRYGIEYAVDNELERMLRYFNEHALNELKIIQNSKLMRGPAALSQKKVRTVCESLGFDTVPFFPTLKAARVSQYCSLNEEAEKRLCILMKQKTFFNNTAELTEESLGKLYLNRSFDETDTQQLTEISRVMFRRPAVVIYSQLGQKLGAQADLEWRRLAYSVLNPKLLSYLPKENAKGEGHVNSEEAQHGRGLRRCRNETLACPVDRNMPISVLSLRSMDVYKYRWVHKLYVRRFAGSLFPTATGAESSDDRSLLNGFITSSSTFVGSKLLVPFYKSVGLRNYLSPHVILVDHEGVIRWVSGGCPDDYEKESFPTLLRQLEDEYRLAAR